MRARDFDLVIFDCDGVLIDSEVITNQVDAEELSKIGYRVTAEELIRRFAGMPYPAMFAAIEEDMGRPLPAGFVDTVNAIILARYQTELKPIAGVTELVAAVDRPKCVASSTFMPKLRMSLELTGLLDRFDPHVYSASQVDRGKPAPDLFLFAASQFNARPDRCLVIEDSVAGVTAAQAAGMPVIGFTGAGHSFPGHADRLAEAGARQVLPSMDAIGDILLSG